MSQIDDRLQAIRNSILAYQQEMREERQQKYTCMVCGRNDVSFSTKEDFDYYIDNRGLPARGASLSKKFIVCGEECRKKFVMEGNVSYAYLMNDVNIPQRFQRVFLEWWDTDQPLDKEVFKKTNEWLEKKPMNGMYLFGKTGVGKTALASAIAWELRKREKTVLWLDAYDWAVRVNSIVFKYEELEEWIEYHKRFDVIIIDDLSKHHFNDGAKSLLINLFQYWYSNNKVVIIASNKNHKQVAECIDDRIHSRLLEMCPAIVFKNKDRRAMKSTKICLPDEEMIKLAGNND